MEKVYIVTSGCYSDYQINAVFSTREKAEEYVDAHGSNYGIEEFPIDEPVERKEEIWAVEILWESGEIMSAQLRNFSYYENKKDTVQYRHSNIVYLTFVLMSDSMVRAKKVASERFMQVKALHAVKFPLLMKECVVERILSVGRRIYPFYDYNTGRIVLNQYMKLAAGIDVPVEYRKETDNQ